MTASEIAPVAYGLLSAAAWGAGDFSGGLAARRTNVFGVIVASQIVGAALLTGLALAFGEAVPPVRLLPWGGAAGLAGGIGLLALYRALAVGRMGVAAPVSAVVTAVVPVVVGALAEGRPGSLKLIGFGLALVGVWLVSRVEASPIRLMDLGLPVIAGLGFGGFLIFINQVSDAAVLWPLVAARAASVSLMLAASALGGQPLRPEARRLPLIALAGALDAGGNTFYALSAQAGRLDVAAVLSSLYPATTVALAWMILKERLSRSQVVGVAAAVAAIVLIAL
jgi:drug/metabolite transporter (DMT)-like permease